MPQHKGKAAELRRWLDEHQPPRIGVLEFAQLCEALAPVNEDYLRKLLRNSRVPLDMMVEGVRQGTLDELETSLAGFLAEYEQGDAPRRLAVRRLVIRARDHARLAGRIPAKHEEKQEMILWLTTWLENPPLFPDWVRIRRGLREPPRE